MNFIQDLWIKSWDRKLKFSFLIITTVVTRVNPLTVFFFWILRWLYGTNESYTYLYYHDFFLFYFFCFGEVWCFGCSPSVIRLRWRTQLKRIAELLVIYVSLTDKLSSINKSLHVPFYAIFLQVENDVIGQELSNDLHLFWSNCCGTFVSKKDVM